MAKEVKKKKNGFIEAILYLISIVIPFALVFLFFHYIVSIHKVPSTSMMPNIAVGDILLSNDLAYKSREIQRGDVVIFSSKQTDNKEYVKRVIGLPGDKVSFKAGKTYINGKKLNESLYLNKEVKTTCGKTFKVPKGNYFVMGDNRPNSYDARFWTDPYVPKSDISSKVFTTIGTKTFHIGFF